MMSEIYSNIERSMIEYNWHHVMKNQEDHFGPLDRWASLNVKYDMDTK